VPFQGELFLDFHIVGVVAGYVLLGWVAHKLQGRFERSTSSLELYVWQYTAIWTSFLIFGSVSVVSQIVIYSFWPIYLYVYMSHLRTDRKPTRYLQQASQNSIRP